MKANFKKGMVVFSVVCLLGTLFTGSVLAKDFAKRGDTSKIKLQKIEITEDQKAEMKATFEAKLKEDVANGKLTQEQADEMLAKFGEGNMPMKGKAPMNRGRGPQGQKPEFTEEQKAEMKAKFEEKLKAEVESGKITQEQADEMLANPYGMGDRARGGLKGHSRGPKMQKGVCEEKAKEAE